MSKFDDDDILYLLPDDWDNPDWQNIAMIHEWKNYISDELVDMWETFTPEQKQAIAKNARYAAGRESWD